METKFRRVQMKLCGEKRIAKWKHNSKPKNRIERSKLQILRKDPDCEMETLNYEKKIVRIMEI